MKCVIKKRRKEKRKKWHISFYQFLYSKIRAFHLCLICNWNSSIKLEMKLNRQRAFTFTKSNHKLFREKYVAWIHKLISLKCKRLFSVNMNIAKEKNEQFGFGVGSLWRFFSSSSPSIFCFLCRTLFEC